MRLKTAISYFRLTEIIFFLASAFIFCLPFMRRKEFYIQSSYLGGTFFEYLTPILYFSEILLIPVFVLFLVNILFGSWRHKKIFTGLQRPIYFLLYLLFISLLSVWQSKDMIISGYYITVLLGLFFTFVVFLRLMDSGAHRERLMKVFIVAAVIQACIASAQFLSNGPVGLHIFGEQYIYSDVTGVAKVVFWGADHIRPYGTFSHTNILSYFLVIGGLFSWFMYWEYRKKLYLLSLLFISLAVLLTFSRVAWFMYVVSSIGLFLNINNLRSVKVYAAKNARAVVLLLVLLLVVFIFTWHRLNPMVASNWESFIVRQDLFRASLIVWKENIFGVGIGNYILYMREYFTDWPLWKIQPVHNSFLAAFVELGILFLPLVLLVFYNIVRYMKDFALPIRLAVCSLVVFSLFDHAFWDIRQAQYLVVFVLAWATSQLEKRGSM